VYHWQQHFYFRTESGCILKVTRVLRELLRQYWLFFNYKYTNPLPILNFITMAKTEKKKEKEPKKRADKAYKIFRIIGSIGVFFILVGIAMGIAFIVLMWDTR
jgi:hypothetical protein